MGKGQTGGEWRTAVRVKEATSPSERADDFDEIMDHRGDAEAALAELRERGLDVLGGEDEPWTVRRAQERHEFLCRCVRTFERLLPEGADMRRVCGLMRQCS